MMTTNGTEDKSVGISIPLTERTLMRLTDDTILKIGKTYVAALKRAGLDVRKARHGNKIKLRTQLMGARLNVGPDKLPGIFIDSSCPNLISEMEGLMWRRHKTGIGEEMYDDNFDRATPDHAFDAACNVLAEYDMQRIKNARQRTPARFYDDY